MDTNEYMLPQITQMNTNFSDPVSLCRCVSKHGTPDMGVPRITRMDTNEYMLPQITQMNAYFSDPVSPCLCATVFQTWYTGYGVLRITRMDTNEYRFDTDEHGLTQINTCA